ncbi:MAG: hypothetical protein IPK82_12660 [Polyangiaceae bacterium]|nr:hypothetical protein [Polyangiaceae bacterium]
MKTFTRKCAALRLAAGVPVVLALSFTLFGCAQNASTTGNTTTTTSGTGASGGSGGSGGTGGTGGSVPEMCTQSSECSALNMGCIVGVCEEGKCVSKPAGDFEPCDDGNACTTNDQCSEGTCVGLQKSCGVAPPCKVNLCNPDTGQCEEKAGSDNSQCDDGDPCTTSGLCKNGICNKGPQIDCSLFNTDCTKGVCEPGVGCKSTPAFDGFACDDGLFCTIQEVCQGGACGGGIPLPCNPPGGCFVAVCDEFSNSCKPMPGNDGLACDDGNMCTSGTVCVAGVCSGGAPTNDGLVCDDGASCTTGEICSAGVCGGGMGPTIYFSDDFSDNGAGWTLGMEWQIAPAKAGPNNGFAFPDPDTDHTSTGDDGVAGVVIGGDASPNPHDYTYLESPPFDTSNAAGPVIFGYQRWLNSEGHPYMHNRVQVYNGSQWITIWSSGMFMFETNWTYMEHDVTNYKNSQMRVRFGFDVGEFLFGSYSSWNVDDVLVASQGCP